MGKNQNLQNLQQLQQRGSATGTPKQQPKSLFHLFSDTLVFASPVFFSFLSSETEEKSALRSPRFLLTSDSQSPRQLGIPPGREASVAKMPSNSHPDASYKLTVSRLAKVFDGTRIHIRSPHLPKLPSHEVHNSDLVDWVSRYHQKDGW